MGGKEPRCEEEEERAERSRSTFFGRASFELRSSTAREEMRVMKSDCRLRRSSRDGVVEEEVGSSYGEGRRSSHGTEKQKTQLGRLTSLTLISNLFATSSNILPLILSSHST